MLSHVLFTVEQKFPFKFAKSAAAMDLASRIKNNKKNISRN
jgi:hypothetical protein